MSTTLETPVHLHIHTVLQNHVADIDTDTDIELQLTSEWIKMQSQ